MMQALVQSPFSGNKQRQFPTSQMINLDIVGSDTYGRFPKISASKTLNMMISDDSLVCLPGYEKKTNISGSGEARQLYSSNNYNHMIAVIDNGVYTITKTFGVARVGLLETSTGDVFIAENLASEIAISDGKRIYIFNYLHNTFETPEIDFLPGYMAFQDSYFISVDLNSNSWRLSDNNNGNLWPADASHVGKLQTKSTYAVAAIPVDRQLFVMGKTVTEPWQDTGAQLFPYQRSNYYSIDYGCLATATIATGYGFLAWLGSNEKSGISIMVSTGAQPTRISTDGIDYELNRIQSPTKAFGFLFQLEGHVFYQLTFTDDNKTYLYDFMTKKFFTLTDHNQDHHIAKRIAYFNGKYYFVSFTDAALYEMDSSLTTYDGKEIPRIRVLSNLRLPNSDRFVVNNITLTEEAGVSSNLQFVDLSKSRDGGYSYGNTVRQRMNRLGNRPNIFQYFNCGQANDAVFQFRFWGEGRFCITSAIAEVYV